MDTNTAMHAWSGLIETIAADLTEAVYRVALRHATAASPADLESKIRKALGEELRRIGDGLLSSHGAPANGRPAGPPRTRPMLERLVSYFGLNEHNKPTSRGFMAYKIIAGPGPVEDSGVATIITLALSNPSDRCDSCRHIHTVETGGTAAAMAAATRYLDGYHLGQHLQKIESDLRA
jgi:hypothetical protein